MKKSLGIILLDNTALFLSLIIIFLQCSGFVNLNTMKKETEQLFYPCSKDDMWNIECETIMPWLSGEGVDVGCSNRSIFRSDVRVDIDKNVNPDFVASADDLPFEDEKFNYLYAIHVLEHMENTNNALKEWARVVKKGGIIAVVHPDVEYTGVYRPFGLNERENPYYEHKHEFSQKSFLDYWAVNPVINLQMVAHGVAMDNWSFYLIFRKF